MDFLDHKVKQDGEVGHLEEAFPLKGENQALLLLKLHDIVPQRRLLNLQMLLLPPRLRLPQRPRLLLLLALQVLQV